MRFLLNLFKPPTHKPEISDSNIVQSLYSHWRIRIFYSIYVGYALFYFTRKCLTFAMPALILELGYTKAELGLLTTTLACTYGISKFINGLIGDRSNPRYFMAVGLIACGLFNIFFGCASSLYLFIVFWGFNGWFQGFGWPSCTRLLSHWYSKSERGRWWSLFTTSQNIGAALIPLFAAFCAQIYGWRSAMICIGCSGIVGGIFLINRLRDTPQSLGLPSIEKARNDFPQHNKQNQENELSAKEILFTHVLNKPILWVLGISYFFIYFIRQAISDWMVLYLVEQKGYSQITAGTSLIWFEIGGVLGGLLAGWASDKIFSGNRGPINALFCMMSVLSIYLFTVTPPNVPHAISLLIFTMGFCLFGPVVLIGIAAAELSHKKAAATATGFIGWIAYIGAASAGYPLGQITQSFGWNGFFITLIGSAAITSLLLLPLWKAKTAPSPVRSFVISVRCSRVKSIEKLASTARLCA